MTPFPKSRDLFASSLTLSDVRQACLLCNGYILNDLIWPFGDQVLPLSLTIALQGVRVATVCLAHVDTHTPMLMGFLLSSASYCEQRIPFQYLGPKEQGMWSISQL